MQPAQEIRALPGRGRGPGREGAPGCGDRSRGVPGVAQRDVRQRLLRGRIGDGRPGRPSGRRQPPSMKRRSRRPSRARRSMMGKVMETVVLPVPGRLGNELHCRQLHHALPRGRLGKTGRIAMKLRFWGARRHAVRRTGRGPARTAGARPGRRKDNSVSESALSAWPHHRCGARPCAPVPLPPVNSPRLLLPRPGHPLHLHRLLRGPHRVGAGRRDQGPLQHRLPGAHAGTAVPHHGCGAGAGPELPAGGAVLPGGGPGVHRHHGLRGLFHPLGGTRPGQHVQQQHHDRRAAGRAGVRQGRAGDALHPDLAARARAAHGRHGRFRAGRGAREPALGPQRAAPGTAHRAAGGAQRHRAPGAAAHPGGPAVRPDGPRIAGGDRQAAAGAGHRARPHGAASGGRDAGLHQGRPPCAGGPGHRDGQEHRPPAAAVRAGLGHGPVGAFRWR